MIYLKIGLPQVPSKCVFNDLTECIGCCSGNSPHEDSLAFTDLASLFLNYSTGHLSEFRTQTRR